ncbi:MAG: S41 family peptidase [Thermogemmata sp.]|nr:S41 family peptidase [Thermogemmata sp.]
MACILAGGLVWGMPGPALGQTLPAVPAASDQPSATASIRSHAAQLRQAADNAERAGSWETAFSLYCQLYLLDRQGADLRDKLHQVWRRLQQYRRQRDPEYQRFVQSLAVPDALQLLTEVLTKVPLWYVDRTRAQPQLLWEHGLVELERALDDSAFQLQVLPQASSSVLEQLKADLRLVQRQTISQPRQARQQLRRLLSQWQERTPVAYPSAVVLEVISGACNGLDEYSLYVPPLPPAPEDLLPQGVCVQCGDGKPVIAGIIRGSWAELHTPLQAGQLILQINGYDLSDGPVTREDVREALRHPHQGWHELVVATHDPAMPEVVVSLPVQPPSVYGRMVKETRDGLRIGYLRLRLLRESTPREFDEALLLLQHDGIQALVLDLRGNLGGSFTAALEVARRLLPRGVIVSTHGQIPEVNNAVFTSESGDAALSLPLVVLIDGETASAAEMLAAALKDQHRAMLVGLPTFGKGTLQYTLPLAAGTDPQNQGVDASTAVNSSTKPPPGGTIRLTIARLISPAGYPLHASGVRPHITETEPLVQLDLAFRRAADLIRTSSSSPGTMMPMTPSPSTMEPAPSDHSLEQGDNGATL